ncbi:MAG: Fic family protein [Bacteroidota bacterium]|nr:Fic family protein [Bacteroidota bacterium]
MEKNPSAHLQEIVFGSGDKKTSRIVSTLIKKGAAKKIAPRIYTTNLHDSSESIIKRNWFRILATQYPKSLLSHRSALECKPTPKGHIYVTYSYTKKVSLPGLIIHFLQGHEPMERDNSFFGELYLSQQARAFLENFQQSRKNDEESKTLTREQLEEKLESIIRVKGESGLNELREKAMEVAPVLEMEKEFEHLNKVISALLNTKSSKLLSSPVARARALGEPFDSGRITLFEMLYETLAGKHYPEYANKNISLKAYQNFAFFESYFSNYIEGTIFEIQEAKQIILTETPLPARNEDSHDVLGTYKIVSNRKEMSACPKTAGELVQILLYRHGILLAARADKKPGQFKDKNNRAGNTEFVEWQLVMGTLKKGFEWYALLQHPFAKAAYIMFLISEVHPFIDGNGRIARMMMNAELSSQNFSKIIVPNVYREDYMGALRKLTRKNDTDTYIRMLLKIYEFSSIIYGEDINQMEEYLKSCDAFMEPKEGKLQFEK